MSVDVDKIVGLAASFEKVAARADMGTAEAPNIAGIISNITTLMNTSTKMIKRINQLDHRIIELETQLLKPE